MDRLILRLLLNVDERLCRAKGRGTWAESARATSRSFWKTLLFLIFDFCFFSSLSLSLKVYMCICLRAREKRKARKAKSSLYLCLFLSLSLSLSHSLSLKVYMCICLLACARAKSEKREKRKADQGFFGALRKGFKSVAKSFRLAMQTVRAPPLKKTFE
jgi:hypothetical protein